MALAIVTAIIGALTQRPDTPDVRPEWAFEQMSARLDRQLAQVDGLDEKAGIFFGFSVALVAGAAAFGNESGTPVIAQYFKVLAVAYGLLAVRFYFVALRVRQFNDAPSAEAIVEVTTGGYRQQTVLAAFMADQLKAIQGNRLIIAHKITSLHKGHHFSIPGVVALIAQSLVIVTDSVGRG